jgi:hypothetical protein
MLESLKPLQFRTHSPYEYLETTAVSNLHYHYLCDENQPHLGLSVLRDYK